MRRIKFRLVAIVMAAFAAAPPVLHAQQTAPLTITLNPAQTAIRWTLGTTLHTVHGTFTLKEGSFRVDPTTGDVSGRIVVDASSGESGDSARDRRMQGDVLESGSFPEIVYRPSHVSGAIDLASGGDVELDGTLHLHGKDHPLRLTIHLAPGGSVTKLTTHFTIPYVEWGMKDPSKVFLHVDKQVALDVNATFASPPPGPAKAILHPGEVHTAQ